MSNSLGIMEVGVGGVPGTNLLDLSEDFLIRIFHALDLESLVTLAGATKKLNQIVQEDFLWMELCRPWKNRVNLQSWRAQMNSGKALFRLLRSLSKLVGPWTHRSYNPRGELLYVTWGNGGVEGWQVLPGTREGYNLRFVKVFDVIGRPDGSHKVETIFTVQELLDNKRFDNMRLAAHIVLPSSRSQNHFVLESHDGGMQLTRNSNVGRLSITRSQSLGVFSSPAVRETDIWRKLYRRLETGEPTPGQELKGLWTGLYGSHGWEILTVSYSDDGFIVGTKVTGDPNVPSGEITFKGFNEEVPNDISTSHDQSLWTKMYRGQGRIAQENFLNPIWVPGDLLVEQCGDFIFVCEPMHFRIRFHRLDLESSFRSRTTGESHNAGAISHSRFINPFYRIEIDPF